MDELTQLFNTEETENPCFGCSQLNKSKQFHCHNDWDELGEADILFVADSFAMSWNKQRILPFREKEFDYIKSLIPEHHRQNVEFTAAVKCPYVGADDMSANDRNICRQHLTKTILRVKPKLVFMVGNLPYMMFTKRSGITKNRGKAMEMTFTLDDAEHNFIAVRIFNPFVVMKEPRHKFLFEMDIHNSIKRYVDKESSPDFDWKFVESNEDLHLLEQFIDIDDAVALDIETTGLDFRNDKIHTISFTSKCGTVACPVDHPDTPEGLEKSEVLRYIKDILASPSNIKVLQNCKFDMKFLYRYGVEEFVNVWDTKVMQHLIDENVPKGLKDLVNMYFPMEIE